jgi:hypothetical protein
MGPVSPDVAPTSLLQAEFMVVVTAGIAMDNGLRLMIYVANNCCKQLVFLLDLLLTIVINSQHICLFVVANNQVISFGEILSNFC